MTGGFEAALAHVLKAEGGFINRPEDRGGPTNFGITKKTLAEFHNVPSVSDREIFQLTEANAAQVYRALYWDKIGLDRVIFNNLCLVLFDQAVNRGVVTVVRQLQEVLNISFAEKLEVDGELGPDSLSALITCPESAVVRKFLQASFSSYARIVADDATQRIFLKGWVNRLNRLWDAAV